MRFTKMAAAALAVTALLCAAIQTALAEPAKGADKIAIIGLNAEPIPFDPPALPLVITTVFLPEIFNLKRA
jgi:hypothetical protein